MWPNLNVILRFILVASFYCAPTSSSATENSVNRIKENIPSPPTWSRLGRAPPNHLVTLRIALRQSLSNSLLLEQILYNVSNPGSPLYGRHLSKEEAESILKPQEDAITAVDNWLSSSGIRESSIKPGPSRAWLMVTIPIDTAEILLNTTYYTWCHSSSNDTIVRTTTYSLPVEVFHHVDFVQPTTIFARWNGLGSATHLPIAVREFAQTGSSSITSGSGTVTDTGCNATLTLSCIRQLYNITDYTTLGKSGSKIGVTGYLDYYANRADLLLFLQDQRPEALDATYQFISVNGGKDSQNVSQAGGEADLDIQISMGLTYPMPNIFYSTAGSPPSIPSLHTPTDANEPYAEWLDYMLSQSELPATITTSYSDDEDTVPIAYAKHICAGFALLGARGASLIFSSGDGGVGDGDDNPTTQQCKANDGRNASRFIPTFPPSCPYVTAVGGTTQIPEVASYFSGGGFSNYFDRPSYQESSVSSYVDRLQPILYQGLYNPHGRGVPDVSAQSTNFRAFYQGQAARGMGTSVAAPIFASIVALLNDGRLARGLPPLGFLNPVLYTKGLPGLTDITSGNNPGCGTQGFNATYGWDPVTGLGTPNFGKLKQIFSP
ncbi:subtilisin-like protein [Gloeophyllum trabeum ATCC 11539]|uniref:tripeptidyl-peptidase II n=1 Tax=Gloeophyllum trabeum (strain ATCC 11539 / FP-39264 / Madison 617) TaxID=670483 RepID=S7QNX1_GLOTA|nr:subtilisin-like protein [Gloeophyllum trabeum ATCC 11539]EPQ61276.1 subtilisin-like protein [Gloeophyllum trabeum ATCC 11539]